MADVKHNYGLKRLESKSARNAIITRLASHCQAARSLMRLWPPTNRLENIFD